MDGPRVEWKSYLCHQTLTFLLTKNHTTIRKVPLGQGKNRGWLWHEKSIICKVWPRGLSSCSLGRDALATGSTVHNRVNVNHYRTCAIISCRLCGFSPNFNFLFLHCPFWIAAQSQFLTDCGNERNLNVLTWKEISFSTSKNFCWRFDYLD